VEVFQELLIAADRKNDSRLLPSTIHDVPFICRLHSVLLTGREAAGTSIKIMGISAVPV